MKKLLITILSCLAFVYTFGIDMGVIEVSSNYTATLIFPEEIESIVFGNNPIISETTLPSGEKIPIFRYYDMYKTKTNVILRSKEGNTIETSITIILISGKVYTGIVKYGERKDRLEYNFSEVVEDVDGIGSQNWENQNEKVINDKEMKARLKTVMNLKDKYFSLGALNSQISFMVGNMKNDNNYSYLKINIINNSASEYIVDGIIFKHTEKKKRKLNKEEAENKNDIMPVYKIMSERMAIKAYSSETIGFVLPIFTTGSKGNLMIEISEKNGSRNATIILSAEDMISIDVF